MNKSCGICGRHLNQVDDPLSLDCGGDCWGCIGVMEADSGFEPSLEMVRGEYLQGLRNNWLPSPEANFDVNSENVTISVKLLKPLGEPWADEEFELKLSTNSNPADISSIFNEVSLKTKSNGVAVFAFTSTRNEQLRGIWFQICRRGQKWIYPLSK